MWHLLAPFLLTLKPSRCTRAVKKNRQKETRAVGDEFAATPPSLSPSFSLSSPHPLHHLPPHSARKRMSVIMRTPSGKVRLYCKGAVSVWLSVRLSPWQRSWQPVTVGGTKHTGVLKAALPSLPLASCQEIFMAASSTKPRFTRRRQRAGSLWKHTGAHAPARLRSWMWM